MYWLSSVYLLSLTVFASALNSALGLKYMQNILKYLKKKLKMVIILSDFGGAFWQQTIKERCFLATEVLIDCRKLQKWCLRAPL